jgi:hypothetical protein
MPADADSALPADDRAAAPAVRSPRAAIVASVAVVALIAGTLTWGGVATAQAVAADRELERLRVADLALLLDARSASTELLAMSGAVLDTAGDEPSVVPAAHEALQDANDSLVEELARALDAETPHDRIIAQSRLLLGDQGGLTDALDDYTRAVLAHARAARTAGPLATAPTLAALDSAVLALAVVPQGLPSSYSGRAALVADVLATTAAVTASHAAEKADQDRREAERRAAEEEAARRAWESFDSPKPIPPVVYLPCGFTPSGETLYCRYDDW